MTKKFRIGLSVIPIDPYSVQLRMAIEQQVRQLGFEVVIIDFKGNDYQYVNYMDLLEKLLAEELDVLFLTGLPKPLTQLIQELNIPVISLSPELDCYKHNCNHPGTVAPLGLYVAAQMISDYLLTQLQGQGTVVIIGGLTGLEDTEDGRTRLEGIYDCFKPYDTIQTYHIPAWWHDETAYHQIVAGMRELNIKPDAIIGLSDPLALVGRAAIEELGLLKPDTLVAGFNGDPLALAAIASGKMAATVELSTPDFVKQVTELALKAVSGQELPSHYNYKLRLVTAENVTEVSAQKLYEIADLPNQLVMVNRQGEQERLTQLETTLFINNQIGSILERSKLSQTIINLIRDNYNFDRVQLYPKAEIDKTQVHSRDEVLKQVLNKRDLIYVPDKHHSRVFKVDKRWPELRSQVMLPVRLGERLIGVLDLHRDQVTHYGREQLIGFQLLADQLAITLHNAELYGEALVARSVAEKADKLKTRLLTNVSHELRTPLSIILGYTNSVLSMPDHYNQELPPKLMSDLGQVYKSADYLLHLTNDLLDLSRAELDQLEITPELIDIRTFLEEVYQTVADTSGDPKTIKWQFIAPPHLPRLHADRVRLRQILLNLLNNARKFTWQGQISLGAELQPPYIHIWVKDSGIGIPLDQQEQIFEPFMVADNSDRHSGGIGLGLTITRHLVNLHKGIITVESEATKGSTFHVYLPLANLNYQQDIRPQPISQGHLNLVYISHRAEMPAEIKALSQQSNFRIIQLTPKEVPKLLLSLRPSIIAWDTNNALETDILIMDYLRKTPQLARLPFMLIGNGLEVNDSYQTGTTNVLLKPFSGQTLQMLLNTIGSKRIHRDGVLIVDDEVQSLNLYQQIVQEALPGLTIHRAESGRGALALLKELVPDLVIIDLMMPEVDGCDVIEWLRTNPPTQNVPVILISGKVLSSEHIKRLEFARVLFQSKNILKNEEAGMIIQQTLESKNLLPPSNSLLVKRAVIYLQNNYAQPLSLLKIAHEIGVNKTTLQKNFHQELGISPWEYLKRFRIKEAKRLLETTNLSITEVAATIGFDNLPYFSRMFRTQTGQSPKEYRNSAV